MAVSVDRVYQTVLAIANKEQRGYITPQEFNLFANQAQNEIFEQYFYDLNQFHRIPGNSTVSSDTKDIIEEKISIFRVTDAASGSNLSNNVYRLESVKYGFGAQGPSYVAEEVTKRQYEAYHVSALTTPPVNRPIFYRSGNTIYRSPYPGGYTSTRIDYIRRPAAPNWTYVVINDKAIWNPAPTAGSQNFELHESEEKNLVVKILQYAGVSLKDPSITQLAAQKEGSYVQQEKA